MARRRWRREQKSWEARSLVFLDETGLNTRLTRLYGRALRGARCLAAVPHGHWHTATFIAALRYDRLSAPWLLDGPMDGTMFLAYVEQVLGPELQPEDLVICDNLSCHKVCGVAEAIVARGARLQYLPAYSPDLNPIEMAFSKLKALLRKAAAHDLGVKAQEVVQWEVESGDGSFEFESVVRAMPVVVMEEEREAS